MSQTQLAVRAAMTAFRRTGDTHDAAAGPKTQYAWAEVDFDVCRADLHAASVDTACDRGALALMQLRQLASHLQVGSAVRPFTFALLGLFALTGLAACYGGGSARADYYNSRAIQAQGRDGDGSVVIVTDRSDELRQAILRAKRVQLAEVSGEKQPN